MRDLYHNIQTSQVLHPVTATTTKTSATVDVQGFDGAVLTVALGQSGDTLSGSVYWTLKLTHSDESAANFTDVTLADLRNGAETIAVNSPSLDETCYSFGYAGTKRYLRVVATASGTHTNGTPMAMLAVLGDASYTPTA